jgi:hypothetical protein
MRRSGLPGLALSLSGGAGNCVCARVRVCGKAGAAAEASSRAAKISFIRFIVFSFGGSVSPAAFT